LSQAKKKPLELLTAADLGLDLSPQNIVLKVEEPAARKAGIFVESVDVLLDKLRNEAVVVK
jgi:electron transfer flavoprotein beta subunit